MSAKHPYALPLLTLSNANIKFDPKMAEYVFWKLLEYFKAINPTFVSSKFAVFLAE